MMKPNPCKHCVPPKRSPGCHSKCIDYIEWRKALDELNERERNRKSSEYFSKRRF